MPRPAPSLFAAVLVTGTTAFATVMLAHADGGGGGGETPCFQQKPGGSTSCSFWIDMTDPVECPDDLLGGSMLPDVQEGSPGQEHWTASGTATCQVNIQYLNYQLGEGCFSLGGWTTQTMSGRTPSGAGC
ncbi:MAG: hypothetical protein KDA05_03575 [Phycisphaerales bacterium]|nr:hypothetical protein [Phycisphaerales bacterium]MCB9840690.1 hypothetical protein [Phycisphaeraceae bacterium]